MKPKISVVIPTHNRPDRVKRAIQSVLNQTFQDFEIIVVDDGVKERAEQAVKSFNDPRIKYIQHSKNQGGSVARNTGIKNAQADWIAFLDDDDEFLPNKLSKQYEIIEKYEDKIDYVFSGVEIGNVNNNDKRIRIPKIIGINNFYELVLPLEIKPMTSTLAARKSALFEVNMFDEEMPASQETELIFRLSKDRNGYAIEEVLTKMQVGHGEHVGGNIENRIKGKELLIRKHLKELKKRPKVLSWHYYVLASICVQGGQKAKAKNWVIRNIWF